MQGQEAPDATWQKKKKKSVITLSKILSRSFVSAGRLACTCDLFRLITENWNILRRFFIQFQYPRQVFFDLIGSKPCRKPCAICPSSGTPRNNECLPVEAT
jgi:hypothetical protein